MRRLELYFHDSCFDGAASAALFSAFYRDRAGGDADVELHGLQHVPGDPYAGRPLSGDDRACVDFRYHPALTWWFDHHQTGFQPASLRQQYERDTSGQLFFDPTAPSCTGLLARVLLDRFGFEAPSLAEVVAWAEVIDSAGYANAHEAVDLSAPAKQIMTWLEHNAVPSLTRRLIARLGGLPLAELAAAPWIAEPLARLLVQHEHNVELIGERATEADGVVSFDLADTGLVAYNKMIPYMLFPQARYSIGVTCAGGRAKVSVGYNRWSPHPREHDISALCAVHGGGGHPVVGAVSLGAAELERVRHIARALRVALAAPSAG
jgi:hypothetical protein